MTIDLTNKHILLGVTGSIAAYKSADLIRRLREKGASVRVCMTENAKQFITPFTLQAVSGQPVYDQLFDVEAEAAMGHIELARWADLVLIAPASANFIARLAHGQADDLLTTLCLAATAPIALAPAMNQGMWHHALTQDNITRLKQKNITLIGPDSGHQACGETGLGRLLDPIEIVNHIDSLFNTKLLSSHRILITAGPTHEAIDPVRVLTNHSSGKMGFALAKAAQEAGAIVTLISGPVSLIPPQGVEYCSVNSARDMHTAVMKKISEYDIFLAVAAVSDYRAETISTQKIHKNDEVLTLRLIRNPDIVAEVGRLANKPFIVGFAAETEDVIAKAKLKRERKNMDMIIANQVGEGLGMNSEDNLVTVINHESEQSLPLMHKSKLARELMIIIKDSFDKCNRSLNGINLRLSS
jgi:phosphopantothenoylcysteine decarboxylase/phosphopantothenate--cysteine ligase